MASDERARHLLYDDLGRVLSPESVETLMDYLPPTGWGDVTRRRDLDHLAALLRSEVDQVGAELGGEMRALGADLRGEMATLDAGIRGEMAMLDAGIRGEMAMLDAGIRGEMAMLDAGIRGEMAKLDAGIRGEMAEARTEMIDMHGQSMAAVAGVRAELNREMAVQTRWFVGVLVAMTSVLATLMVALH
jgi:hypothetical protein